MEAWLWLISREARGVDDPKSGLKRGEFCASRRQLSQAWGWSRSSVQRFLEDLQKGPDPMIESLGHKMGQFAEQFSICKYETYNPVRDKKWDTKWDIQKKDIKKDKRKDSPQSKIEARLLFDIWMEENRMLPNPRSFGPDRKRKCAVRISEAEKAGMVDQYLRDFRESIRKAQETPFLCGKGPRGWKATFDWFISNHRNAYKVLEGNYEGSGSAGIDVVGQSAVPHRTPREWKELDWKIFEKVNGMEATLKLMEEYGVSNYQPNNKGEFNEV